ncbi:amidohydrolase [Lysinibacillus sp. fkY74-1]|uniref:amidohydrolase n=1 Tax=Lysinibacillus TaxID=400634 RepID=UPI0018E5D22A|nr:MULTISPECIES: amidohydrolase [Lysinibacillus]MBI6864594.1 amidohydrolase [Lysinibacillus fusiformis]MDM5352233.1 amidohydrolase [Lysinibacillus sphaericus]MEB7454204.1 amidohydrolase [Lysinibacillus sphaericus]QTB26158.1 amidohydrolase [Lysinibacillus sphaericus]
MNIYHHATFLTVNEQNDVFEQLWVEDGRIVYVGPAKDIPPHAHLIDLQGAYVTPGLIDIHAHVGTWAEVTEDINDANEYSEPFTPLMHALDSVDIRHFSFQHALAGGVTTVQTGPGSANVIGGIWSILKTAGPTLASRVLVERSGLKGALGENPKNVFGIQYKRKPMTRMAIAQLLRDGFQRASLLNEQEQAEKVQQNSELRPFIEVLRGEMPLRLHCHRADDIMTAIRIAKEFNVKLHLEHCTEGYLIVDAVKNSGYHATLGPYMLTPSKYETRHSTPAIAAIFKEHNIPFAIMTDHPFVPIQYLKYCASEAIRYGLDEQTALKSITIHAAKLVQLDHRIGSLEKGKDADFVVWSHPIFETEAKVLQTYVNGEKYFEAEEAPWKTQKLPL